MTTTTTGPAVYAAIAAIQGKLAKVGIAKSGRNVDQKYNFRGIDAVYAALAPLLAEHGLSILPRVLSRTVDVRATANGKAMYAVALQVDFDFVAVADGSKHTVTTFGEASDTGDKATNKAMSAAYKYAAFMAFAIPVEGEDDADASTPEATYVPGHRGPAEPPAPVVEERDWAAWTLEFCAKVAKAPDEAAIDALRDGNKREINAAKKSNAMLYQAIGNAFADRRAALAPPGTATTTTTPPAANEGAGNQPGTEAA